MMLLKKKLWKKEQTLLNHGIFQSQLYNPSMLDEKKIRYNLPHTPPAPLNIR